MLSKPLPFLQRLSTLKTRIKEGLYVRLAKGVGVAVCTWLSEGKGGNKEEFLFPSPMHGPEGGTFLRTHEGQEMLAF